MKKKIVSVLCAAAMATVMLAGCGSKEAASSAAASAPAASSVAASTVAESTAAASSAAASTTAATGDIKIALITMDSIDQYWVKLNDGAQAEAKAKGVEVKFMSPAQKDDAQQIECVNNAVSDGYNAIMVAANGPDSI